MSNTLKELSEHLINIEDHSPIQSAEKYHLAKRGEEIDVPIYVETVDKLLKYYENLDYSTVVTMYLDLCDTLDSARNQPDTTFNLPHVISYNKSIALGLIINAHIREQKTV